MAKIICPGCRKSYNVSKLEKDMVKCWTCGVLYNQKECKEDSNILSYLKPSKKYDKKD